MPKALKVSAGERVDLVDFVHGSKTYVQDTQKALLEQVVLDNRARILDGFRVQVEDQSVYPGLVTVINGSAINRAGQLVTNEDVYNDARTLTLVGGTTTFYLEVELVEPATDTDARFFWDPTVVNTAPQPNGSEFALNVATRTASDWRVVTPVSTTGFAQDSDPNSLKIPVCKLSTDGANKIDVGSNAGLVFVYPATVLETDVALGSAKFRVLDARMFPTTPLTAQLGYGTGTVETVTVTTVDRVNSILYIAGVTVSDHLAGAIVRVTTGNTVVQLNADPSSPSAHPDVAQRVWQANELRGAALTQAADTYGARNDQSLASLKDHVDFLAAQIRDMKFGSPRPDVTSTSPPGSFATRPRYFDPAGSITGARTNTVSVGDGTTSFGDFNGTDQTVFTAALAALPSAGGTLFVKRGTYTLTDAITIAKQVRIVGEGYDSTIFSNTAVAAPAFSVLGVPVTFENLTITNTGGLPVALDLTLSGAHATLRACAVYTGLRCNGSAVRITAHDVLFQPNTDVACVSSVSSGYLIYSEISACTFIHATNSAFTCRLYGVLVTNSLVQTKGGVFTPAGSAVLDNVEVSASTVAVTSHVVTTGLTNTCTSLKFSGNYISVTTLPVLSAVFSIGGNTANLCVTGNTVSVTACDATTTANASAIIGMLANTAGQAIDISRNYIITPVNKTVILYWSDLPDATGVNVHNNYMLYGSEVVRLGNTVSQMTGGTYSITDNYHYNAASCADVCGINFYLNKPAPAKVIITGNTFRGYTNSSAGSRKGVSCASSGVSNVLIENNTFAEFGNSATTTCAGVYCADYTSTPTAGSVHVRNNSFTMLGGAYTTGILLDRLVGSQVDFQVTGNHIENLGEFQVASATHSVEGVACYNLSDVVVAHNTIRNVASTVSDSSGTATCVYMDSCGTEEGGAFVSANKLALAYAHTSSSWPATSALVFLSGTLTNVTVANNSCAQNGGTPGTRTHEVIAVYSDNCTNLAITGNRIATAASGCPYGIRVNTVTQAGAFVNTQVVGNTVVKHTDALGSVGIFLWLGDNSHTACVDGNTVLEAVLSANATAIQVMSDPAGTTVPHTISIQRNVLRGVKTGTLVTGRRGIDLVDCSMCVISGNVVDWMLAAVATGHGIAITSAAGVPCTRFVCTGNVVTPALASGSLYYEINIDETNMTDGVLHSNLVGEPGSLGVIKPNNATANFAYWRYGDSASATLDFNHYGG